MLDIQDLAAICDRNRFALDSARRRITFEDGELYSIALLPQLPDPTLRLPAQADSQAGDRCASVLRGLRFKPRSVLRPHHSCQRRRALFLEESGHLDLASSPREKLTRGEIWSRVAKWLRIGRDGTERSGRRGVVVANASGLA
jgi:hypothetical protein